MTDQKPQFEVEDNIMKCWNVTSDLNVITKLVLENDFNSIEELKDTVSSITLGLNELYEARFDFLMRSYERLLKQYYKALRRTDEDKDYPQVDL